MLSSCPEEAALSKVACLNGHNKGQTVCRKNLFTPLAKDRHLCQQGHLYTRAVPSCRLGHA